MITRKPHRIFFVIHKMDKKIRNAERNENTRETNEIEMSVPMNHKKYKQECRKIMWNAENFRSAM